ALPRCWRRSDSVAFREDDRLITIDPTGKNRNTLTSGWSSISGSPCWKSDAREIWFTASQGGTPEALWAVDRSGKRRLVTRVPGRLELEDLSHDGRVLLAHHTQSASLMGLAPGASKERELSWLDLSRPAALSVDGKTLVIAETGEASPGAPSVYMRGTDGSPAVRLGEGYAFALSPDGRWVLAGTESVGGKPNSIVLLPTGTGQTRTLKNGGIESFGLGAFM